MRVRHLEPGATGRVSRTPSPEAAGNLTPGASRPREGRLWGVEEDRDDPDMLAVERMRRPAAELGPNWLEIMMGRAREDGVAGW